jgi:hypothetical protein
MDAPRPQRNRIHLDVSVPHDEAQRRIQAALAAGGTITYDAEAPAFWVLADLEGNEACITTWQGRDPGQPSNTVAQSFLMLTTVHPWVSASSRERSAPVT